MMWIVKLTTAQHRWDADSARCSRYWSNSKQEPAAGFHFHQPKQLEKNFAQSINTFNRKKCLRPTRWSSPFPWIEVQHGQVLFFVAWGLSLSLLACCKQMQLSNSGPTSSHSKSGLIGSPDRLWQMIKQECASCPIEDVAWNYAIGFLSVFWNAGLIETLNVRAHPWVERERE